MQTSLHIVIPVYNEADNFPGLRSALLSYIASPFDAYLVYDFDEDNTIPVVQRVIDEGDYRFHLAKNTVRRGVVGAIQTGFKLANRGPVLVVMGDLSDDLSVVDKMLSLYQEGYDLVVPSRYMPGGRMIGGPLLKRTLSRMAGLTLHWFRGVPTCDATNSFKLYDAEMLQTLDIESRGGFEISLEITVKAFIAGYRIAKVPS